MNFLIFDKDGAQPGQITQSNKVYEHEGYDKRLQDHGVKDFISIEHPTFLSPDHNYVSQGVAIERPIMPVLVSKTQVKCDGIDSAVFTLVPTNALVTVSISDGTPLGSQRVSTDFDVPIPVPCTYNVKIELWPFQDFNAQIEGVA